VLFGHMVFFSFAYITLSTGTGALILFGAVQLTMFGVALRSGERFSATSWAGLMMAFAGLIYLVSPGVTAPDPVGAVLMAIAGIAWGFYSLLGRSVADPLEASASGAVASGIAYAIWYKALRGLTATQAATLGGVWIVLARRSKSAG